MSHAWRELVEQLQLELLVQLVMAILLAASLASWVMIFQRWIALRRIQGTIDEFEDYFWSGIDLRKLYAEIDNADHDLTGIETLFVAGFKEYSRLSEQAGAEQPQPDDQHGERLRGADHRGTVAVADDAVEARAADGTRGHRVAGALPAAQRVGRRGGERQHDRREGDRLEDHGGGPPLGFMRTQIACRARSR